MLDTADSWQAKAEQSAGGSSSVTCANQPVPPRTHKNSMDRSSKNQEHRVTSGYLSQARTLLDLGRKRGSQKCPTAEGI